MRKVPAALASGAKSNLVDFVSNYRGTDEIAEGSESEVAIFDPTQGGEFEATRRVDEIRPAKLPILFTRGMSAMSRATCTQPNHFGVVAPGIRQPSVVRRTESFYFGSDHKFKVEADRNCIYVVGAADETETGVASIDAKTGETSTFIVEQERRISEPKHIVVTDKGIAFASIAYEDDDGTQTLVVTHVDPKNEKVLWSKDLFNESPHRGPGVNHLGCLPGGDLIAIYGRNRIGSQPDLTNIRRFDGNTGKEIFDKSCGWHRPEIERYLPAKHGVSDNLPRFSFYDERTNRGIIGLFAGMQCEFIQFFEIDFETGDVKEVGEKISGALAIAQSRISENQMLLQKSSPQILTRDSDGHIVAKPFEGVDEPDYPLMTNLNGTHAVQASEKALSFFEVHDEGLKLIKTAQLPNELATLRSSSVPSRFSAMTSDDVYYFSGKISKNGPSTYRLYAYDATTGKKLWELDEQFDVEPALAISPDGTLTWVDSGHALILEAPL